MTTNEETQNKPYWIIRLYPLAVLIIAVALNFLFGLEPVQIAMPSKVLTGLLTFSALILLVNHTWIMTKTELTRARYQIFASPEEWYSSGQCKSDVSEKGSFEIERCLNTHRNTTENSVYYVLLVIVFALVTPGQLGAWLWILAFPVSRLGYTFSYFRGSDNVRGVFMSLSLLSVYGMASYLALSFLLF